MLYHYNENYVVNEYGECFSLFYGKLRKLKSRINKRGYVEYRLRLNGKTVTKTAHHLSYWVNIGHFDSSDGFQIDHIDGNKLNNHYTNLRRVTPRDNVHNVNTARALTSQSKSDYRLYDDEKLPSEYIKSEKFDSTKSLDANLFYIDGKWVRRNHCQSCGRLTEGKLCKDCFKQWQSRNIPSREKLIKDLMSGKSILVLARGYGISDNAYRKWLIKRGLPAKSSAIKSFLTCQ